MEAFQFVRLFEEDSVIYGLLKNDFKIDDQSFELSDEWGIPFFIDSDNVAYVPIRSTMEEFGVHLNVPEAKGQIRFYDQATEQSFVFQLGSLKATVNGQAIKLKHKIVTDGPFAYVSADDLFGLLGAKYKITHKEDGESVMEVTRDL
nr:stalk domain-containing protein [Cohnella mopanensis]